MVETVIRIVIFVVLASFAVWYCNDWFKKKQKLTVSRTRKKWKRLCKDESFDGRSIASQRLDSRRLLKFGRIISFPIVVLLAAYISNFAFKLPSSEPEQWGQMGDFFGGMLNPILAFASFIALLYTVRLQTKEMAETRIEFERSAKAQEDMVKQSEGQLLKLEEQINFQQEQFNINIYMQPIREKIGLIWELMFEYEPKDKRQNVHSLHGLFQSVLKAERNFGIPVTKSGIGASLRKEIDDRGNYFFQGKVKRILRELEIIDFLMSELSKLKSSGSAINALHAELGMPAAICEMLNGYDDIEVPKWKGIMTGFFYHAKKIQIKPIDTSQN